jgi:hypothetical protein
MPFERRGFLGGQATAWATAHRERHAELFGALDSCNETVVQLLASAVLDRRSGPQVVTASLIARCVQLYGSLVILLERGLCNPARALPSVPT